MIESRNLRAVLVLGCLLLPGCQPASDVPAADAAADGGGPPPPPPLPTDTGAAGSTSTDTGASPPPEQGAAPSPLPPAAGARTDCGAPAITAPAAQRVRVFFSCGEEIRPVERPVESTRAVLRTSLEELLEGPNAEERAAGFTSFFGEATAGALRSVVVRDGVAHIDFADFSRAIPNASTSAGSTQLLGQIHATVFQYPSIESARITFEGSCDAFWDWLQRGCMPMNR